MMDADRAGARSDPRGNSRGNALAAGSSDRGSGSILGIALIGSVTMIVAVALPLYIGLGVRESVSGSADAAALAAADVAIGIAPGGPCAVAAEVSRANGTTLTACSIDGLVATVRVDRRFLAVDLSAEASAGPQDAVTN